jgi:hypothetical protein
VKYYTYIYLDPRKKGLFTYREYTFEYEPFYVGKGHGERCDCHLIENKNLFLDDLNLSLKQKILVEMIKFDKVNPIILKVKENISEQEAFDLEILLILLIGRLDKKTGPLTNLTDGGEGPSGRIPWNKELKNCHSKETLKKISESQTGRLTSVETKRKIGLKSKGKNNGMYGKTHTKEVCEFISKNNKGKFTGEDNPFYGKHHTKETKHKLSLKAIGRSSGFKGKTPSNEAKKKISEARKGKIPWNKGISTSEETKEKIRKKINEYYERKRNCETMEIS